MPSIIFNASQPVLACTLPCRSISITYICSKEWEACSRKTPENCVRGDRGCSKHKVCINEILHKYDVSLRIILLGCSAKSLLTFRLCKKTVKMPKPMKIPATVGAAHCISRFQPVHANLLIDQLVFRIKECFSMLTRKVLVRKQHLQQ